MSEIVTSLCRPPNCLIGLRLISVPQVHFVFYELCQHFQKWVSKTQAFYWGTQVELVWVSDELEFPGMATEPFKLVFVLSEKLKTFIFSYPVKKIYIFEGLNFCSIRQKMPAKILPTWLQFGQFWTAVFQTGCKELTHEFQLTYSFLYFWVILCFV